MSLRIEDLVKEYRDPSGRAVRAVDGVSLEIAAGELVTLLGPSGCGKTTTLRMIAGFEKPTSGEIWIGGRPMAERAPFERDTPMVFQSYALFPHLSVRHNARFGLEMRKVPRKEADDRVARLAAAMGLEGLLDRSPHALSGGQQQRVALLRALVVEPKVLLFDEPLSNLDARLRVAMRQEIRRIQKGSHITAVYVTHDQEEAMALSDRIAVMEKGRLAQFGPPREVYARPASRFVAEFLGEASFVPADSALGRRLGSKNGTRVIRPESVHLLRDEGAEPRGVIRVVQDLGPEVRYEIDVESERLFARALVGPGEELFREGDRVSVAIDRGAVHTIEA